MQEKIDDAIDDATGGIWEIVTTLNKLFFYAERICSLITTINRVASFFKAIGMLTRGTADAVKQVRPDAATAIDQAGMKQQTVTESLNEQMKDSWLVKGDSGINKFCKFISCRLFFDEGTWAGEIGDSIGSWQRGVMEYANLAATGGALGEKIGLGGKGVNAYTYETGAVDERGGTSSSVLLQGGKLNPKDSIVMSFATLCLPGIIFHLNKYRQIKCMYADCLQTSVDTGIPVWVCEDQKEYETCKYIYGEIFQLLPFTGLLNYFIDLVKGVLSSPFGVIDLVMGRICMAPISTPFGGKVANLCLLNEMAGMIADVWSDISNIKDDWDIKNDYCKNIEEDDEEGGSGLGGLF